MRNSSWIALAIIFLIVFFAANNTAQSGVKPDWWVNGALVAQRSGGNFIPGANISITGADDIANDRVNITIASTGAAASNSFAVIDAPSGTDPAADSPTDTLQLLVTGADFSVTGNAAADSVTFDILSHAGTDITVDLEEEGQLNTTAVAGNAADDTALLGTAASAASWTVVVNCADTAGNHLNYTQSTNTFSCGTSTSGLTQAYHTVQDEGAPRTQRFTLNFIGAGISCVDNAGSARTDCTVSEGGIFSGEVDDTTNDSLTFTSDDASPPADAVRHIYARTTNDLKYGVPYPGGQHQFTVGATGSATITEDRFIYPSSNGTPTSLSDRDTWIDTQFDKFYFRVNQINNAVMGMRNHWSLWISDGAGGPSSLGDTLTTAGTVTAVRDSSGSKTRLATAATIGAVASLSGDPGVHAGELSPFAIFVFQLNENTAERAFFGLTSATCATAVGADDPAGNYVGLHYSSARDTNFQYVTDDNTTQTLTNSGIAVNTLIHFLTVFWDNSNARVIFSLDEGAQTVVTATIPAASTGLRACTAITTTEAVVKSVDIGTVAIEERNGN